MEEKRWFLLLEGQVSGPYSDFETEERLQGAKEILLWGRGHSEWMSPQKWRAVMQALLAEAKLESQKSRLWKMRVDHKELTPMTLEELVEQLKDYTDLSPVRIWTEGFEDWKEVYQVQKVVDELGISRRTHPRVPIMGSLKCEATAGPMNARLISISEGGVGVNNAVGLQIGEKFEATLTSPNLLTQINAAMEVVYVGTNGYAGLRFLKIPSEARAALIDYVKKFAGAKSPL